MNKQIKRLMFALIVTCAALLATARAQPPDRPLDEATRKAALAEILQNISERYVFPDAAPRIVAALRTRIEAGEYDKIATVNALADVMSKHLYEASKDKHLYLRPGGASAHRGEKTFEARGGGLGRLRGERRDQQQKQEQVFHQVPGPVPGGQTKGSLRKVTSGTPCARSQS